MSATAPVSRRALVYSGGYGHLFDESSGAIARLLEQEDWAPVIETDIDDALELLPQHQLLIVNALYWSMTQHEKYAADRGAWAYALPDPHLATLRRYVEQGGGLLVMHTGTICWDTQPGWIELIGGGWQWGQSYHPPLSPISVTLTAAGRELSAGAAGFEVVDEAYHRLDPEPDCVVLAQADAGEGNQPVAWQRRVGAGRVAVDALGHDARSLDHPDHAALIAGMISWLGEPNEN